MQVKNKIIEQLEDQGLKESFYKLLDEDVLICKATEKIANDENVAKCGDRYIVFEPTDKQQLSCVGRVIPLYVYLPEMKDEAEFIANLPEEQALKHLDFMKEQYEPKDVYDFLMQGHTNGTLWNILDYTTLKEFSDKENGRNIEITEIYHKGEWHSYVCSIMDKNNRHLCGLSYDNHNIKSALKYFSNHLQGTDKSAFDKFMQSEVEM
ncbi:MAG: hypothetical protein HDT32_03715 [Clostridiales bacterium]|nr:hypothetical protein [Clostridiales bacterium]